MVRGKIAKILNDHQVVINRGSNDGVQINMGFIIYEEGEKITDPETNEDLGALEIIKGRVRVHYLQERVCVCATDKVMVYEPGMNEAMKAVQEAMTRSIMGIGFQREKHLPLPVPKDIQFTEKKHSPEVQVGDLVRSV
jgi:hypothetical protein